MLLHFNHVAIVVEDADAAINFFCLLGFAKAGDVVVSGEKFATYMGVKDVEARHVTLALKDREPRQEIQLVQFINPEPYKDPYISRMDKLGYNHLCIAVDNIEAEVARLKEHGVVFINQIMQFNNRKLVYFAGPGNIIMELAQWD